MLFVFFGGGGGEGHGQEQDLNKFISLSTANICEFALAVCVYMHTHRNSEVQSWCAVVSPVNCILPYLFIAFSVKDMH